MAEPVDRVHQLSHDAYPWSNGYDPDWVIAHQMGPNPLWMLEALTEQLEIEDGSKVQDLGCGMGLTSIFLAREFGAEVWATDLWIAAEANQHTIAEAGVERLVHPIHAEAHALPFEADFFDTVVSIDAYQYFGTDDLYLGYLLGFLKPGGRIGAVMPAGLYEFDDEPPEHMAPFWEWDFCAWHGPDWWRRHWAKTTKVDVECADSIPDGWRDWLRFNDLTAPTRRMPEAAARTHDMLVADRGRYLGFTRIVATKRG